jgi:hypothetical protein
LPRLILAQRQDRLGGNEAELSEAPLECVELILADAPRVGRVRTQQVERDLFDDQRGTGGGEAHALRFTTALSRGVRLTMRNRTDR